MDSPSDINWISLFVIKGLAGLIFHSYSISDEKSCIANPVDPDQLPHNTLSDLSLHYYVICLGALLPGGL